MGFLNRDVLLLLVELGRLLGVLDSVGVDGVGGLVALGFLVLVLLGGGGGLVVLAQRGLGVGAVGEPGRGGDVAAAVAVVVRGVGVFIAGGLFLRIRRGVSLLVGVSLGLELIIRFLHLFGVGGGGLLGILDSVGVDGGGGRVLVVLAQRGGVGAVGELRGRGDVAAAVAGVLLGDVGVLVADSLLLNRRGGVRLLVGASLGRARLDARCLGLDLLRGLFVAAGGVDAGGVKLIGSVEGAVAELGGRRDVRALGVFVGDVGFRGNLGIDGVHGAVEGAVGELRGGRDVRGLLGLSLDGDVGFGGDRNVGGVDGAVLEGAVGVLGGGGGHVRTLRLLLLAELAGRLGPPHLGRLLG